MWILRCVAMGTDELSGPLCGTCIGGHGPSPLPVSHDGDFVSPLICFAPTHIFFRRGFLIRLDLAEDPAHVFTTPPVNHPA